MWGNSKSCQGKASEWKVPVLSGSFVWKMLDLGPLPRVWPPWTSLLCPPTAWPTAPFLASAAQGACRLPPPPPRVASESREGPWSHTAVGWVVAGVVEVSRCRTGPRFMVAPSLTRVPLAVWFFQLLLRVEVRRREVGSWRPGWDSGRQGRAGPPAASLLQCLWVEPMYWDSIVLKTSVHKYINNVFILFPVPP